MYQTGGATLYQSPEWVRPFFQHVCGPSGGRLLLVLLKDSVGVPVLLLPLKIVRHQGVNVAQFIGGKHSNFNLPLVMAKASQISPEELRRALLAAGRRAGVDLFALLQQPYAWDGVSNPLRTLDAHPSANLGYLVTLKGKAGTDFVLKLSKGRRRKLLQKRSILQRSGDLVFRRASTTEEARKVLSVFFLQKAARMHEQGIGNPFEQNGIQNFLKQAVIVDDASRNVSLEIYYLSLDGDIVAVYGLLADGRRASALFTSFGGTADVVRHGPGLVLLHEIVRDLTGRGFTQFDMGVGEAAFKSELCDETLPLFDSFLPVTGVGSVAALVAKSLHGLKRFIKQSPRLMRLANHVRRNRP